MKLGSAKKAKFKQSRCLHDSNVVAELKLHLSGSLACHLRGGLHDSNVVAELKPSPSTRGGASESCLHDSNVVAELKPYRTVRYETSSTPSPRLQRRGRIEARTCRSRRAPTNRCLHDSNVVAELKPTSVMGSTLPSSSSPRLQRRGRIEARITLAAGSREKDTSPRLQRRGRIEAVRCGQPLPSGTRSLHDSNVVAELKPPWAVARRCEPRSVSTTPTSWPN